MLIFQHLARLLGNAATDVLKIGFVCFGRSRLFAAFRPATHFDLASRVFIILLVFIVFLLYAFFDLLVILLRLALPAPSPLLLYGRSQFIQVLFEALS